MMSVKELESALLIDVAAARVCLQKEACEKVTAKASPTQSAYPSQLTQDFRPVPKRWNTR